MEKPQFNIGDQVYSVSHSTETKYIPCPVCFDKRYVTIIKGDDSQCTIDCEFCSRGYEGSRGVIDQYIFSPRIERIEVENIQKSDGKWRYNYHDHCFATKEEAEKYSLTLIAAKEEEQRLDLERRKEYPNRSWSWNAGWHTTQLKEAKRKVEYHTAKLEVAKKYKKEEK